MSAPKKKSVVPHFRLRERIAELGHVIAVANAVLAGAIGVAAIGGESARGLSALRILVVEAKGATEEAAEIEKEIWRILGGGVGGDASE